MHEMNHAPEVDARYRTMTIIWLAQLLAVAGFILLTLLMPPRGVSAGNDLVFFVLLALALLIAALSFFIRRGMLARAIAQQQPALVQQACIVGAALCEAAALFGLVSYFAGLTRHYYLFFVIGGAGMLLHKPSRDQLLAASATRRF